MLGQPGVLEAHELAQSHRWAHVQDDGRVRTSRLLSPRRLQPGLEYVAVVVPAFDDTGERSWDLAAGRRPGSLPVLHSWRFWTGEEGDFETLAFRIMPRPAGRLGRAPLAYRRGPVDVTLQVRGAITSLGGDPDGPPEAAARADLAAFTAEVAALTGTDPLGRAVIGLPPYGRPWVADLAGTTWTATLNADPRYRGTAGLGLEMGLQGQDELVAAATRQLGAAGLAEHLVGELAFGLLAARSLWTRRRPAGPARQVLLYAPLMQRLPTPTGTALGAITGPTSPLERALFSTAARRTLRHGAAWTRHTAAGAVDRDELIATANTCPVPPEPVPPGLPHVDVVAAGLGLPPLADPAVLDLPPVPDEVEDVLARMVGLRIDFSDPAFQGLVDELSDAIAAVSEPCERHVRHLRAHRGEPATHPLLVAAVRRCLLGTGWTPTGDPPVLGEFPLDPDDARTAIGGLLPDPRLRPCAPPDLDRTAAVVGSAIDPHGPRPPARRRIAGRIRGLDLGDLGPVDVPVGLDFPTWTLLRDHAQEWLLPGIGTLATDSVVAMQTNPTFIDAYLVGLNTQLHAELHWRNLPTDRRATPLLMFWGHVDFETGRREADIRPLADWAAGSELGDLAHQVLQPGDTTGKRDLVIVFRTDLFRRYPRTLVYLAKPTPTADAALRATPNFQFAAAARANRTFLGPIFQGAIARDVVFFAFDVDPDTLDQYWLVLDEPPTELRFRSVDAAGNPLGAAAPDAAAFALATIDKPTRVGIDGSYLEQLGLRL